MAPPGGQKPFPIGVAVEGSATGADIRVTGTTTRHLGWQWGWCDRMLLHLPLTTPQVEAMTDDRFLGDVQTVRFTSLRNDGISALPFAGIPPFSICQLVGVTTALIDLYV